MHVKFSMRKTRESKYIAQRESSPLVLNYSRTVLDPPRVVGWSARNPLNMEIPSTRKTESAIEKKGKKFPK